MNTEQYLNQIKRYEHMIDNKLDEINRLRQMCTSVSIATDKENIVTSKGNDKLADAIAKIVDLERETDELVDGLCDKRRTIIAQIDALGTTNCYLVLSARYVRGMKLEQIADKYGFSIEWVKKTKRKALKEFEKVYGKQYLHIKNTL